MVERGGWTFSYVHTTPDALDAPVEIPPRMPLWRYHPGCPCGDTTPDAPAKIPGPDALMPVWRSPQKMTPSDNK